MKTNIMSIFDGVTPSQANEFSDIAPAERRVSRGKAARISRLAAESAGISAAGSARRPAIMRRALAAGLAAAAVAVGVFAVASANKPDDPDTSGPYSAENIKYIDYDPSGIGDISLGVLYGKNCTSELWEKVQKCRESGEDVDVLLKTSYVSDEYLDFIYEGKPIREYNDKDDRLSQAQLKMQELLAHGDDFKKALFGTAEEMRRAKEEFGHLLDYVGEELCEKYIVNGEFLKEDLARDLDEMNRADGINYDIIQNAKSAFNKHAVEQAISRLKELGVPYSRVAYRYVYDSGREQVEEFVVFRISVEGFEALDFKNNGQYVFSYYRGGEVNQPEDA